jgi:hypothetical protein
MSVAMVTDREGREVTLTEIGWQHIVAAHRDMSSRQTDVLRTVAEPDLRTTDVTGRDNRYRVVEDRDQPRPLYIKVCVSYRMSGGTIVTAFPTRRVPRTERTV